MAYLKEGSMVVKVLLDNGVYYFDGDSATGKTLLCKVLKRLRAAGEFVDGFTFEDSIRVGLRTYLCGSGRCLADYNVVVIDRYDMYAGQYSDTIEELSQTCVVLIDCKGDSKLDIAAHMCNIRFSLDSVEVSQ